MDQEQIGRHVERIAFIQEALWNVYPPRDGSTNGVTTLLDNLGREIAELRRLLRGAE